jgi:predicted nicotinamide N-methyase
MAGKRDFILANTGLIAPPLTPEIRLRLADEAVPIWRKTEEELGAMGLPPPFWAFAWAGGQALARYALDNPALVRGKRALDFGSGSGLVAIAAAMPGAAEVEASDIDAFAIAAIEANTVENGVKVTARQENLVGVDEGWEVVLAGDVAYERELGEAAMEWLASLASGRDRTHRRSAALLSAARAPRLRDRIFGAGDARTGRFRDQADWRVPLSVIGLRKSDRGGALREREGRVELLMRINTGLDSFWISFLPDTRVPFVAQGPL